LQKRKQAIKKLTNKISYLIEKRAIRKSENVNFVINDLILLRFNKAIED